MNEVADTTQGPFHFRLAFFKRKQQKPDYVIDNIADEYSKKACPLTKPKSQGVDEVQQIPDDESGRWLILRNHDFSKLAQSGAKKCQKFPSKGSIYLKFEVYNGLGVIYSLDTIFNKQNKELPPQAKIHVDKNHKENPLESDYLFLRTTDGYLTVIRFFLADSIYEKATTQLRKNQGPKEQEFKDDMEYVEELDSSNKENSASANINNNKNKPKGNSSKMEEDILPEEPPSKQRKVLRRAQSVPSVSSQEELEIVKRISPIKKTNFPFSDNNTKVKLKKNFDLFESTDSELIDLDETIDNIQPILGKHARDTEESNQYGMVKLIRQTLQDKHKHKTSPEETSRKKTKTQEQSSSPVEDKTNHKKELNRTSSFSRNSLKNSNGMDGFMDLRISNDAIILDSDNDNNNLNKSFHLFYEGTPEEEEFFSQSFAEAKKQVDDTSEVDMSKLAFSHKELLGSGTFAKVFRGTYQGSLVAVKMFNHFSSASHLKLEETMRSESIIMKTMSHMNVVKWVGANWVSRVILLELCTRGNLFSWIHSNIASPARKRTKAVFSESKEKPWNLRPFVNEVNEKHPLANRFESIAIGVAKGLQHIHNNDIIHCDISSMNILLDEKWVPKIADFGVSCMNKKSIPCQNLGASRWRAPEMYIRSKKKPQHIADICTNAVDVFALGMVLFEMEVLSLPFPNRLDPQVEDTMLLGGRPTLPEMHPRLKELIKECWSENPEERPQASQLVERLGQLNKHS